MLLTHISPAQSASFCHAPFASQAPEGAKPRHFPSTWAFSHPRMLRPISFPINILHHKSLPQKGPERPSFSLCRIFYRNPAPLPTLRRGRDSMSAASSPPLGPRLPAFSGGRELSLPAGKAEAWLQHSKREHGLLARDTMTSLILLQGMTRLDCFLKENYTTNRAVKPYFRFRIADFRLRGE
jgi:hypothetical protein